MTNLDKWKAERIKEIEDMDIDDVAEYIRDSTLNKCRRCIRGEYDKGCAKLSCLEGIKAYLESEEQ